MLQSSGSEERSDNIISLSTCGRCSVSALMSSLRLWLGLFSDNWTQLLDSRNPQYGY